MKKTVIITLVIIHCVLNPLIAQKVTVINSYPVIDLNELSSFNIFSIAEANTRRTEINNQTPYNTSILKVGLDVSGVNGSWNKKMSPQFQIMRADLASNNWAEAYNSCKNYKSEGGIAGQWRLPTQRELMMIYILHPQLIGKGGCTAFNGYFYWTCTEDNASYNWYVSFYHGETTSGMKSNSYQVRCVRDF